MADDLPVPADARLDRFALALTRGDVSAVSALDADQALSPLADSARRADLNEELLARELVRGLRNTDPGADHARYLRLAAKWLGYRVEQDGAQAGKLPQGSAAGGTLAAAVAGALVGARAAGVLKPEPRVVEEIK